MEATQKSIAIAEALYRHKWDFGTARSRALKKYHNVAKDTLYDFAPKLDSAIFDAQNYLNLILIDLLLMAAPLLMVFKKK